MSKQNLFKLGRPNCPFHLGSYHCFRYYEQTHAASAIACEEWRIMTTAHRWNLEILSLQSELRVTSVSSLPLSSFLSKLLREKNAQNSGKVLEHQSCLSSCVSIHTSLRAIPNQWLDCWWYFNGRNLYYLNAAFQQQTISTSCFPIDCIATVIVV